MTDQTDPSDAISLADQYREKLTADLVSNADEQKRITAELEALQARLETLRQDHALILRMQESLASRPLAAADSAEGPDTATKEETAAVPRQRRGTAARAGAQKPKAPRRAGKTGQQDAPVEKAARAAKAPCTHSSPRV
ncbi:hypothetical protein ACFQ2B_39155 [Streptomyces stramineus]